MKGFRVGIVFLFLASFSFATFAKADCVAKLTVIMTDPSMVHELCWDMGARFGDDGTKLEEGRHVIMGCTNGRMLVIPHNLDANILKHEFEHIKDANCSDDKKPKVILIQPPKKKIEKDAKGKRKR